MFQIVKIILFFISTGSVCFAQTDPFDLINSPFDEQNPVISPDGRTLYYTVANHPQNVGGEIDPGDIWYSNIQPDGTWSSPANARMLNNKGWNGVLGFVGGSDAIYLMNHYSTSGNVKTQGIARSLKTTDGWSYPENFDIPYFINKSKMYGGYISNDAGIAIFSIESYDTRGGEDLYVCFNEGGGKWSEPKNLGNSINTKFQEFTPFLSEDTKTLYFATNSRGNGTDLYMSERLDDSWINWTEPLPLILLNTDGKEFALRIYGEKQIYTSTVNSDGYGDIKEFINPEFVPKKKDSLTEQEPVVEIIKNKPEIDDRFITLYGNTYNAKSNSPIETTITLKTVDGKQLSEVKSPMGSYALKIEAIGTYFIRVDALGFVSHQESLILESDEIKMLEQNYELQPIEVGTTINLKDVLFKQSRAEFLQSSYAELNLVVEFMKENPKVEIRLEGHTDNRGVAKYNLQLSKERVDAVKDYLVKKGISKKRISGKGYGGSRPIANNDDPLSRIRNRRVEFTIVKN